MDFEIRDFVSTAEKLDTLDLTVQESNEKGVLNSVLLNILFDVNVVLMYTDVSLELDQDKYQLYDILVKEGVIDKVYATKIDDINNLKNNLVSLAADYRLAMNSPKALVEEVKNVLIGMADETAFNLDTLKDLDLSNLKDLLPLAESLGINLETPKK